MHIKPLTLVALLLAVPVSVCAGNAVRQPTVERGSRMTIHQVATVQQFNTAIANARAGDVIELAAGDYSALSIRNFNPAGNVTIRSANADNPAHIADLFVQNSSNLTFTQLDIGRALNSGEVAAAVKFARFDNVDNLTIDRVHVHGSLDGNPQNDGRGMEIKNSSNVVLSNSEFEQVILALAIASCQDVTLVGNKFHDVRSDGINVMATDRITIDSNHFTNFNKVAGDHSDAIQFWTTNQDRTSTDIVIRNNQMIQGTGSAFQGIFLRDDSTTMPFERVTIENNLVYMYDMPNGIMVKVAKDVTIANNTVISPQTDNLRLWIRLEMVENGTVSGNVTELFYDKDNSGVSYTSNVLLKDSPQNQALILDLNTGPLASIARLLVDGYGYRFAGVGSAIYLPVVNPVAAEPPVVEEETPTTDPVPAPTPDPDPVTTTDPTPAPDPVTQPEEVATTDPVPTPTPVTPPQDTATTDPDPAPAPTPAPEEVATTNPDPAPTTEPAPVEQVVIVDPVPAPIVVVAEPTPTPTPTPAPTTTETATSGNGNSKKSAVVSAKPLTSNKSGRFAVGTLADTLSSSAANDPFAIAAAGGADGSVSTYRPSYDYALVSNG